MGSVLPVVVIAAAVQFAIMATIFFISGQLLPQALAPVYQLLSSAVTRTVVASIFIFPLANWTVAWTYAHFPPGLVAPAIVAATVIANVSFAIAISKVQVTPQVAAAVGIMLAGAVWASVLITPRG